MHHSSHIPLFLWLLPLQNPSFQPNFLFDYTHASYNLPPLCLPTGPTFGALLIWLPLRSGQDPMPSLQQSRATVPLRHLYLTKPDPGTGHFFHSTFLAVEHRGGKIKTWHPAIAIHGFPSQMGFKGIPPCSYLAFITPLSQPSWWLTPTKRET